MTTNYVPCGKCGKPAPAPMYYVPPVTWEGKLVCMKCSLEIQRTTQPEQRAQR